LRTSIVSSFRFLVSGSQLPSRSSWLPVHWVPMLRCRGH